MEANYSPPFNPSGRKKVNNLNIWYLDYMKAPRKSFNIGDLVKPLHPTSAMTYGVVVYCHGRHDSRKPRVRYATGWGVTSKSDDLVLLTPEEVASLPTPVTIDRDLLTEGEILTDSYKKLGFSYVPAFA